MRMTSIAAVVALWLLVSVATASGPLPSDVATAGQFAQWGVETLAAIDRDLWIADRQLYADKVKLGEPPHQPAFMWGAGVQLSAMAAAAQFDAARHLGPLTAYADKLQSYWVEHHGIGGYDVLPRQWAPDRYYDDNAWIVLALLDLYEAGSEQRVLDRAASTMCFVLSGEDETLGGGIYWRENARNSKNTCANAPAIVAALRLFRATSDQQYLADAERIYKWTRSQLQDAEDGLYWDNIRSSGWLDRRKFSYNSALMIRANCLLYQVKRDPQYLAEAQRIARSAAARWIEPETGAVNDAGCFAHMLLESLLHLDQATGKPQWQDHVYESLTFVHQNVRDPNGHYRTRWHEPQGKTLDTIRLIDQASAARAYFAAAIHLRKRSNAEAPDGDTSKPVSEIQSK